MRWTVLLGVGILSVALLVSGSEGGGGGGEPKKGKDGKATGFLPQNWKELNLTAAQKEKVYETQAKYKAKLEALKEQEKALKQEEKADLGKILTDDQREMLRKIVVGENTKKKDEKKDDK